MILGDCWTGRKCVQVVCRGVREQVVKGGRDKMSSVKLFLSLELAPLY